MNEDKNTKPNVFQFLYLPVLFVQYLFSFALAAGLKLWLKPEETPASIRALNTQDADEEKIDPNVMKVVRETGEQASISPLQLSR